VLAQTDASTVVASEGDDSVGGDSRVGRRGDGRYPRRSDATVPRERKQSSDPNGRRTAACMSLAETVSKIDRLSDEERECIEICNEAAEVSEWCADECLGDEEMEKCARLCRDVADITSLHARFMARDSNYSPQFAEACVGVCEECAAECEQHDADHCQVTAGVLRDCAESCRSMLA